MVTPLPSIAGPLATHGSIAFVGTDGSLHLIAATGQSAVLDSAADGAYLFPAWSPDGSHIAAIRTSASGSAVAVFDTAMAAIGGVVPRADIFRSATYAPFYLMWTPDGASVSFLASDRTGALSLMLAPAAASAPLTGSEPGTVVRTGQPFYFDWIAKDRLFAHVGSGSDAFLGEIGLDGTSTATAITSPGDFRSPVLSPDRRSVAYVRTDGSSVEVVVRARDGSGEQTMPVFGPAAIGYDPTSDRIASIGPADEASAGDVYPAGPLRVLDGRSGAVRTILDGRVLAFWWSPDGQTIAALQLRPAAPGSPAAALASPTPAPDSGVRLMFIDVASGTIVSQLAVRPDLLFINQVLAYFDQYALSHHLWAPDSSSLLMPILDDAGDTKVAVVSRDGGTPTLLDGLMAFWSP